MQRVAVLNVVGLSRSLISPTHTPFLDSYLSLAADIPIAPQLPAVTTSTQTTYLTGVPPSKHGIVGNGWFSREDNEIKFWKQSNALIAAPNVWEEARRRDPTSTFTVANSFWWYNMYSSADYSCTPRPMYPADGRKLTDVYTQPPHLRDELQAKLGQFPLFNFWGPKADIIGSTWIAESAKFVEAKHEPTLHLVYLPHLDYALQKVGPAPHAVTAELLEIDALLADLVPWLEARGIDVVLLSEYGMAEVDTPVHINRALRAAGLITVREELGRELLDAGACRAFAVADHQVAHVYVKEAADRGDVRAVLEGLDGVEMVLDEDGKREHGIDHARAGDFVCVARPDAWFTYYYWTDDERAPDFARCVDIHRKPGYDPVELFVDPEIAFPMAKAAWRIAQKEMGFRYLMDLIPLDATLVRGSHGHLNADPTEGAVLITKRRELLEGRAQLAATDIFDLILKHLNL
ncbi:unnamed protein product [Chondrus crispus]|uniref:Alkaline phosphatase family protein n=1 Tax=Chondrus crispus TaxID=2769 RepID=R7QT72_CHOCR|nr:unnamed protein product [Chondrus crispus]CDF40711.1 unnamed protein product [Chondrus crispus]|eukprot:XP_005711005.1 unnamed protein product [Chondrus crispus]